MSQHICSQVCRGLRGCRGAQGREGHAGTNGPRGQVGPQGTGEGPLPLGPQGLFGVQGLVGDMGPQGPSWNVVRGFQGRPGFNVFGSEGFLGWQGAIGMQGFIDDSRSQGFRGIQGTADFATGPQGWNGDVGFQGKMSDAIGVQGAIGPQGFMGPQQPDPVVGMVGFEGAQGPHLDGPQGFRGSQGPEGTAVTGLDGAQGIQGPKGGNGQSGAQGDIGSQGNVGIQGSVVNPPSGPRFFVTTSRTATDQQNILLGQASGRVTLLETIVTQGDGVYIVSATMSIQSLDSQITDAVEVQVTADDQEILMATASFSGIRIPFLVHTLTELQDNARIRLSWREPSTSAVLGATNIRLVLQKVN